MGTYDISIHPSDAADLSAAANSCDSCYLLARFYDGSILSRKDLPQHLGSLLLYVAHVSDAPSSMQFEAEVRQVYVGMTSKVPGFHVPQAGEVGDGFITFDEVTGRPLRMWLELREVRSQESQATAP